MTLVEWWKWWGFSENDTGISIQDIVHKKLKQAEKIICINCNHNFWTHYHMDMRCLDCECRDPESISEFEKKVINNRTHKKYKPIKNKKELNN